MTWSMKMRWSFLMVARSTVSFSSFDSLTRNGRASATKSVRAEAASRKMVGPSRTRPVGDAAITSFSASSAATMRCTVERARSTRWAIWPRLKPGRLFLERAQDRGGAGDDLDLALVLALLVARFACRRMRGPLCFCTSVSRTSDPLRAGRACRLAHPLIRFNQNTVQKTRVGNNKEEHGQEDRARRAFPVSLA